MNDTQIQAHMNKLEQVKVQVGLRHMEKVDDTVGPFREWGSGPPLAPHFTSRMLQAGRVKESALEQAKVRCDESTSAYLICDVIIAIAHRRSVESCISVTPMTLSITNYNGSRI